jgi:hypothetical protein
VSLGAEVVGLGEAEFGVTGQGLAPVMLGLAGVSGGLVAAGEAAKGAGFLVLVARLAGHSEGGGVLGAGLTGLVGREQGCTEAVAGPGLLVLVADLAGQGGGGGVLHAGRPGLAGREQDLTDSVERLGLS